MVRRSWRVHRLRSNRRTTGGGLNGLVAFCFAWLCACSRVCDSRKSKLGVCLKKSILCKCGHSGNAHPIINKGGKRGRCMQPSFAAVGCQCTGFDKDVAQWNPVFVFTVIIVARPGIHRVGLLTRNTSRSSVRVVNRLNGTWKNDFQAQAFHLRKLRIFKEWSSRIELGIWAMQWRKGYRANNLHYFEGF